MRGLTSQTGQTGYYIGLVGFIDSYSERWVQEFRLVSPGDHRLRWIGGGLLEGQRRHSQSQQEGLSLPGPTT